MHLCWLGVDDLWLPGRAAHAHSWIDAAPGTCLHLSANTIVDRSGKALGTWRCPLPVGQPIPSSMVLERLLIQNFIAAPSPIFRKDAWLRCGGLDETLWYTADWDMWLKLAATSPVYYHDLASVGFRIHSESLTSSGSRNAADFAEQMRIVLDRHLSALRAPATTRSRARAVERAARASIMVNSVLAASATGHHGNLPQALLQVLRLGPTGIHRYMRDSRIIERLVPRLRAKFSGRL
jgi:hypothetical protein